MQPKTKEGVLAGSIVITAIIPSITQTSRQLKQIFIPLQVILYIILPLITLATFFKNRQVKK